MLRLLVSHGEEEYVFPMPQEEVSLGSSPKNGIVLRIPGVSRTHALLRRQSEGVEIRDRGSKNGVRVGGMPVQRTVLTPGLRVQIGKAWLGVEEVPTSEEAIALLSEASEQPSSVTSVTPKVAPIVDPKNLSPTDAALVLAYHIAQVGVGIPEERSDLLFRVKTTLGADAFATLRMTLYGNLRAWETVGDFSTQELKLLSSTLGATRRVNACGQVVLRRAGTILMGGVGSWFIAARFSQESLAQAGWRKELLRFLSLQFFVPVRTLRELQESEVSRVYWLAGENKAWTADLLDVTRKTLYDMLERLGLFKRTG
jgi:pSer/pThr/pTyr-binding forkhead associated (FHA) protein